MSYVKTQTFQTLFVLQLRLDSRRLGNSALLLLSSLHLICVSAQASHLFCPCVCRKGTGTHTRSTCLKRWSSWGSSMQGGSWRLAESLLAWNHTEPLWLILKVEETVPPLQYSFARLTLILVQMFISVIHHTIYQQWRLSLCSRGRYWLLSPATSLILIMVTPQRSYMTSQMIPPHQVIYSPKHTQKKRLFSRSSIFLQYCTLLQIVCWSLKLSWSSLTN